MYCELCNGAVGCPACTPQDLCPTCLGEGMIEIGDTAYGIDEVEYMVCPLCEGNGYKIK